MHEIKNVKTELLVSTRKALHQAVQLVAAFPRNVLPHDETDESASLIWNSGAMAFESQPYASPLGAIKVGLSVPNFELYIHSYGEEYSKLGLEGISVNNGLRWLKNELGRLGVEKAEEINLNLPYEIEDYNYDQPLVADIQCLYVLSTMYQLTKDVLDLCVKRWTEAYAIRCWPHHFDLATLIPLAKSEKGELTKSMGIGLSPGDDSLTEPYFYINRWPNMKEEELRGINLKSGYWNTSGWTGAVLTFQELSEMAGHAQVLEFVDEVSQVLTK
ncbi:MAG: hypothetical protein Tsb0034_05160 [Ekhidna sp.]